MAAPDKFVEAGLLLEEIRDRGFGGFFLQSEVHAFVTTILLGVTRLDALDAEAEAEPPDRQLAEIESSMRRSEGHTVVAADVGGQAALFKKALQYGKSVVFAGGRKRLTSEEKAAGVVGDGQQIAVLAIAEQELAFVIGAPQFVGFLAERQGSSLGTAAHTTAVLDQTVAIEHGMDGAFGRDGNAGESAEQPFADFARAPTGVFPLHVQNIVLYLKGKLVGVAIRTTAAVGQTLNTALLIAIEDLVAGPILESGTTSSSNGPWWKWTSKTRALLFC